MNAMRLRVCLAAAVAMSAVVLPTVVTAQGRRGGGAPPVAPRAAAPIDLTGYWASIVSEDWRWRMGVGQKGDYGYLPLNAEGRRVGDAWDPTKDAADGNQCKAYGAAAIMRVPGRLHVTWENDTTLKVDIDTGTQSRLLHFGGAVPGDFEPALQGYSVANWQVPGGRGRAAAVSAKNSEPRVVTTKMRAGYYFKHGVPYSENATLTEYFAILSDRGTDYLAVTSVIDDPRYLAQQFVRTLQFRREPNGSKWNPTPCA